MTKLHNYLVDVIIINDYATGEKYDTPSTINIHKKALLVETTLISSMNLL